MVDCTGTTQDISRCTNFLNFPQKHKLIMHYCKTHVTHSKVDDLQ